MALITKEENQPNVKAHKSEIIKPNDHHPYFYKSHLIIITHIIQSPHKREAKPAHVRESAHKPI